MLTFALIRAAPGDPVSLMAVGATDISPSDLAVLRQAYGLDEPILQQYLRWLGHVLKGDFGHSLLYRRPVAQMIGAALPNTVQLSVLALLVALIIGVPLGTLAALPSAPTGRCIDSALRSASNMRSPPSIRSRSTASPPPSGTAPNSWRAARLILIT